MLGTLLGHWIRKSHATVAERGPRHLLQVPPNGLVVYTGTIMTDDGKEKKVNIDFEPFKPINTSLYLCDNKFHTEALNELLESDNKWVRMQAQNKHGGHARARARREHACTGTAQGSRRWLHMQLQLQQGQARCRAAWRAGAGWVGAGPPLTLASSCEAVAQQLGARSQGPRSAPTLPSGMQACGSQAVGTRSAPAAPEEGLQREGLQREGCSGTHLHSHLQTAAASTCTLPGV